MTTSSVSFSFPTEYMSSEVDVKACDEPVLGHSSHDLILLESLYF